MTLSGTWKILTQKFPNIAVTSISYLRDFLVDPSPILAKLHLQAVTQQQMDKESPPLKILGTLLTLLTGKLFFFFTKFFLQIQFKKTIFAPLIYLRNRGITKSAQKAFEALRMQP